MKKNDSLRIKVVAENNIIHNLQSLFSSNIEDVKIIGDGEIDNSTKLEFGLLEISAIITIISSAFYIGKFCGELFKLIKEHNAKKVYIQTPIRTVEINNHKNLSKKEIKNILEKAIKLFN